MERIGFIGTGVMGRPMAANLLRAGYPLSIIDRNLAKAASLLALGASSHPSAEELARASDVIILMLPDTKTVEQVLFESGGVAHGVKESSIVVDMSTISAAETVKFSSRLAATKCDMLDAPVSGGESGAEAGTLGIMVGGPQRAFDACSRIFSTMGKTIVYAGPSGCGQKTKLINQLVGATNLLGAVEGIRLARAAGLNPETTLKAISSGAAASWMLTNLGAKILQEDFAPGFSMRLQFKDVSLLKDLTMELGGDYPAASLVYSLFERAIEAGLAPQGNQGLINLWNADGKQRG
jgi:3-hydroxyisobutyrate dehydrogenase